MAGDTVGYLPKNGALEGLFQAINTTRHNGFFVPPFFKNDLIDDWLQMVRGEYPPLAGPLSQNTRERHILKLIAACASPSLLKNTQRSLGNSTHAI